MIKALFHINTAIGLSITILPDGGLVMNACKITANNNQLDIDNKVLGFHSMEELTKRFPAKAIVAVNINGKGVLHKQTGKIAELTPNIFSQLLPNANFSDFYCQNFISGEKSFISLIRRQDADRLIAQLTELDLIPVMLSLGPFPVFNILSQINIYDQEIIFDGHLIQRDEQGVWTAYQNSPGNKTSFQLKIESEKAEEELIIPYAAAFQLVLSDRLDTISAHAESLEKSHKRILEDKKYKAYAGMILAATFILLLANFLLFTWLTGDNEKLAYQISSTNKTSSDVKTLEDQVKAKEQELQGLGWDGGISKAYLIDQLASVLPKELTWKQIDIGQVDPSASRIQRALIFNNRQIRLTGFSERILPVNEWMARIKIQKWVKDVQLENYLFNTEASTGQFVLTITY